MLSGQAPASVFDPCPVCGKYLTVGENAVVAVDLDVPAVQLFHTPRCWDAEREREPATPWREVMVGVLTGEPRR